MNGVYWYVLWINIFIFEVETVDLNRLIWFFYENILAGYILEIYYYFLGAYKITVSEWSKNSDFVHI